MNCEKEETKPLLDINNLKAISSFDKETVNKLLALFKKHDEYKSEEIKFLEKDSGYYKYSVFDKKLAKKTKKRLAWQNSFFNRSNKATLYAVCGLYLYCFTIMFIVFLGSNVEFKSGATVGPDYFYNFTLTQFKLITILSTAIFGTLCFWPSKKEAIRIEKKVKEDRIKYLCALFPEFFPEHDLMKSFKKYYPDKINSINMDYQDYIDETQRKEIVKIMTELYNELNKRKDQLESKEDPRKKNKISEVLKKIKIR